MKIKAFIRSLLVVVSLSTFIEVTSIKQSVFPPPAINQNWIPEATPLASYPISSSLTAPQISLMFTGDINLGRCVASTTIRRDDFTFPFQFVAEKLKSADITIGSLDSTISNETDSMPCPESMNLIGPQRMVEGLQFAGFDIVTIATNHIKDCGEKGFDCQGRAFFDTLANLRASSITPVGGGNTLTESRLPVVVEVKGIRFAFLAVNQIDERVWATESSPGTAPLSQNMIEQIKQDVSSAKTVADVVIVLPHWGIEYADVPEEYQRSWAQEFLNAGATLVVGNHPHIVQPAEAFSNGVAFYALGNFVFDQGHNFRREGIVVQATFNGSQLASWNLEPVSINYYTYQPSWVDGSEGHKIIGRATALDQ